MPKIQVKRDFPNRTAKECYTAFIDALHEANYKIFKQRDIGWFVIASQVIEGKELTCNAFASMGTTACIELNLSASNLSEDQLEDQANILIDLMQKRLN